MCKRVILVLFITLLIPTAVIAEEYDLVEIKSDDIIFIEPEFTDFIKDRMPHFLSKLVKLEKERPVKHIKVEFNDFKGFWKNVKSYYSRVHSAKESIEEFEQESLGIREQIFKESSIASSPAIKLIISYKFLKKNIADANKEIETLGSDLDILISLLKTSRVRANAGSITDLKSYTGALVNGIQDLKLQKIDFAAFKNISISNVAEKEDAEHLSEQFIKLAIELTGAFDLASEITSTKETLLGTWGAIYNFELYVLENKKITIASLSQTILVMLILLVVYRIFKLFFDKVISDHGRAYAINTLGKYWIVITISFVVLSGLGLDLSKITLLASALSVGIGFGLSTMVSNFVSGIILLLEGSVRVGDILKLEDGSIVTVEKIGLRKSVLFTGDHLDIIVPNINLVSKNVINLTYTKKPITRNRIDFSVNPNIDFEKLEKVALESIINTLGGPDKIIRDKPVLLVPGLETRAIHCQILVSIDNLSNFVPDSLFKKNLLRDFTKNNIDIFLPPITQAEMLNK